MKAFLVNVLNKKQTNKFITKRGISLWLKNNYVMLCCRYVNKFTSIKDAKDC